MKNQTKLSGSALEPLRLKLEYWNRFDEADRRALLALPHTIRHVEAGQYLVREFDRPDTTCVMLSGFSMRQKIVAGGHRQILSIHMKGEVVDLQNAMLKTVDHSVQMLTRGTVATVPSTEIEKIAAARPAIGKAMWIDTLVDGSVFREWVANIGRRDARTRIAHLLCELSLRLKVAGLGEQNNYEMPLTQEQLADATGLTPVHVNRSIKYLEAEKLIERGSPRSITIGDWRKLADFGDFQSQYLHLQDGEPALA